MNVVQHVVLAIAIQLIVRKYFANWFVGATVAASWAISREITQAEYRWIEVHGHGLRANMPWWGGLDPSVWQKLDPWIDWIAPTLVTVAIALAMRMRTRRLGPSYKGAADDED